ncbi:hypothetical protein EDC01DRAFT_642855 [Geopyxis carbonaria]|nr:hypothetical protein EDC01DRAFT_642855 [Geopyxis carbonaria]
MLFSTVFLTILSATSAAAYAHGTQKPLTTEHNCKEYLRAFLLESLQAIPEDRAVAAAPVVADKPVHATESCDTYSDCGFCGFYERCCYKEGGHSSSERGHCMCGISGREKYCA